MKKIFVFSLLLTSLAACDKKADSKVAAETAQVAEQTQEGQEKAQAEPEAQPKEEAKPTTTSIDPAKATLVAPAKFKAKFNTTKGEFVVDVDKELAPIGADRFYNLVKLGFYNDVAFFRVIDNFMAQFGMNGDPAVTKLWQEATLKDDPVKGSNERGTVSFAKTNQPNSRTTQLFINYANNSRLDSMGFAPFGKIDEKGMKVVDALFKDYGEGAPGGAGPSQDKIRSQGNAYLKKDYPNLDYIKTVEIIEEK